MSALEFNEPRKTFLTPLKNIGTWLCFLIAMYFAVSAAFALLNFERYGTAIPQFLRYILVPLLIMLVYLLAPFLVGRQKVLMTGIYSLSILAALFLSEALLTARVVPVLLGSLGQLDDEQRRELEQEERMIRGFTLPYLNIKAEVETLSESKLSGFPGARTLLCSQPEGALVYTADRYGFNNPDSVYDNAPEVVVIGDSFTEGFCLPEGEDLVAAMREKGMHAVSFGIRGNGPLLEMAAIGRYGPSVRPDHVVMAFFEGNDWRNLQYELSQPWLREALDPDADFGSALSPPPETEDRFWAAIQNRTQHQVTTFDLLHRTPIVRNFFALHRTGQALGLIYPKVPPAVPEFETVLKRTKSIVEGWGGAFSLLFIPDVARYAGLLPNGFALDHLRQMVLEAAAAADVDVIDLTPIFHGEPKPKQRFYAANGHFSEEGADFAAAIVANALRDDGQDRLVDRSSGDDGKDAIR